jgi:hypothetical protein
MWNEAVVVQFDVLSIHFHGGIEENRENFIRIVVVDLNQALLLLQTSRSVSRGSIGRRSSEIFFPAATRTTRPPVQKVPRTPPG